LFSYKNLAVVPTAFGVQIIVPLSALFLDADNARGFKILKVVGNGRLGHLEVFGNRADTHWLFLGKQADYLGSDMAG
jgi:hypothetical protein